jgi:hypothetical protein
MKTQTTLRILVSSLLAQMSTLGFAKESYSPDADKWRAESIVMVEKVEGKALSNAEIYATAVGAPLGYILLMRKDGDTCAIRFTEFHRGNDSKPQTRFRTNEETLYAEYDWHSLGDKNRNQAKRNAMSGHESLIYKPIVGYGHLRIQRGKVTVKCGALEATWAYPVSVSLLKPNGTYESNGIEVAPTQWAHVGDVNLSSPELVWYQYSEARELAYIPLEDLPGRPTEK